MTLVVMAAVWLPFGSRDEATLYAVVGIFGFQSGEWLSLAPVCAGHLCRSLMPDERVWTVLRYDLQRGCNWGPPYSAGGRTAASSNYTMGAYRVLLRGAVDWVCVSRDVPMGSFGLEMEVEGENIALVRHFWVLLVASTA